MAKDDSQKESLVEGSITGFIPFVSRYKKMSKVKKKVKAEDWESDDLWRQNGYYMITVEYGAEKLGRFIVKAVSFGKAIQKIVNDDLKEYPQVFEYDSVITFKRETFEEIK